MAYLLQQAHDSLNCCDNHLKDQMLYPTCLIQIVLLGEYFPLFEMPQMPYFLSCDGNRFSRAGSMVLALHDASDVFLEIGKLTKYCGSEIVPSISFLIFALSWLILRLIYFPFFIIWSTRYVISIAMQDGYVFGMFVCLIFQLLALCANV